MKIWNRFLKIPWRKRILLGFFALILWGTAIEFLDHYFERKLNDLATRELNSLRDDLAHADSILILSNEEMGKETELIGKKDTLVNLVAAGRRMRYEHDTAIWSGDLVVSERGKTKILEVSVVARLPHDLIVKTDVLEIDLLIPNGSSLFENLRVAPDQL